MEEVAAALRWLREQHPPGPTGRKHFWRAGKHDGYTWWDAEDDHYETEPVRDNADSVRNRDTKLCVKVIDDRGGWFDDSFTVWPNNVNPLLPGRVDGENDKHERVKCPKRDGEDEE